MDVGTAIELRRIIEKAKIELVNRFELTNAAMRGEFMSTVYSARVPSAEAQSTLDRKLSKMGNDAAIVERVAAKQITEKIHKVFGMSESSKEDLAAFSNDIAAQIGRDALAISALFRKVQTTLNGLERGKRDMAKAQALQYVTKPEIFSFKDKAGKIWNVKTYLKANSSKYYYGLTNYLAVGSMRAQGLTGAVLNRPSHKSDGLEVGLADINNEFRARYLHPGSQGILT